MIKIRFIFLYFFNVLITLQQYGLSEKSKSYVMPILKFEKAWYTLVNINIVLYRNGSAK